MTNQGLTPICPLFFGHLAVEKLLKAIFVSRHKNHPPPIHNLVRSAKLSEISLDETQIDQLLVITSFNLEARYPDITREFRKKCTRQFTAENMNKIMGVIKWLQTAYSGEVDHLFRTKLARR
ncbi:MAG: HEPN domain-containing protein [Desulfobacteraceae bacterium]|nr:MAG: HEPN domain-containing protein [Desulfobacteraceae bacterium]